MSVKSIALSSVTSMANSARTAVNYMAVENPNPQDKDIALKIIEDQETIILALLSRLD